MAGKIDVDAGRARQIIKGRVRRDLKKYLSQGGLIGRKGKDLVKIPIPDIDLPRFRFGSNHGGAGQGDGEIGDPIARGPKEDDGGDDAGDQPGRHIIEEFTMEELAEMMAEELELPRLVDKKRQRIVSQRWRYRGLYDIGPESLCVKRRTLQEAIRHSLMFVDPDEFDNPAFDLAEYVFVRQSDKRYRLPKIENEYSSSAAVIYMMDVSGSMDEEKKEVVRTMAWWIDVWIRGQYKGVESRYLVHDTEAQEVDQDDFYHITEGGGTKISSVYRLCGDLITPSSGYQSPFGGTYSPDEWNIYVFHFTDGDNWGDDDNACLEVLRQQVLGKVNLFGYAQIKEKGKFLNMVGTLKESNENVATAFLRGKEDIYDGIKALLSKGR